MLLDSMRGRISGVSLPSRVYDIWVNLVQELQVKLEVVVSTMKTNWENQVCSPKADLVKFLDDDNEIVEQIQNAGGEVSAKEI